MVHDFVESKIRKLEERLERSGVDWNKTTDTGIDTIDYDIVSNEQQFKVRVDGTFGYVFSVWFPDGSALEFAPDDSWQPATVISVITNWRNMSAQQRSTYF